MKNVKIVLNSLFTDIVGQILFQLLMLLVVPLYLDLTTEALYGYWLTITSILAWLSLTDFGIEMSLTREAILVISKKDKLNALASTGMFFLLLLGFIFLALGISLINLIPQWLNIPSQDLKIFQQLYFIAVLSGSISLPFSCFNSLLEAHGKLVFNRFIEVCSSTLGALSACTLLIFTDLGILSIAYGLALKVFFKGISSLIKTFKTVDLSFKLVFEKKHFNNLFNFGGYFQISKIANSVALSADNIIITSIIASSAVVSYTVTMKLASLFGIVIASKIPIALFPGITEMVSKNNSSALRKLTKKLLWILTRLGLMMATTVLFVNEEFISLWLGKEFYGGWGLNLIFVYWVIFETIIRGVTIIVFSYGDLKQLAWISIIEACMNLTLSFILGKKMGLIGIALATSISRTFTIGLYVPFFLMKKKLINMNVLSMIFQLFLKVIPIVLIIYLCSIMLVFSSSIYYIVFISTITLILNIIIYDFKILKMLTQNRINLVDLTKHYFKIHGI